MLMRLMFAKSLYSVFKFKIKMFIEHLLIQWNQKIVFASRIQFIYLFPVI